MHVIAYRLPALSILDHLAIENSLIAEWDSPEALLLFYINSPCVVIGRNQNPWREAAPGTGIPLFRRASGGGTVYHDEGNLNWSLIVPRPLHSQEAELAMMAAAISAQGFDVVPGPRGGLCFGPSSEYAGRKVSGTARRFNARNVIHHGTLLVDADMSSLDASLGGIETFDDASLPSVKAAPINLSVSRPTIEMEDLIAGISCFLTGMPPRSPPAGMVDISRLDQEKRILSSPEWIFGATPPFSISLRVEGERLALRVEKGRVEALLDERGDSLSRRPGMDELSGFIGLPFSLPRLGEINAIVTAAKKLAIFRK